MILGFINISDYSKTKDIAKMNTNVTLGYIINAICNSSDTSRTLVHV
jgi:hypothetical protein